MNTNYLAKSAVLATAATMRARAESGGASPSKDDTNGLDGNGNGHVADPDATTKSKKKKKNKKRNSRSSLTAEDVPNGVDAEDDDLEQSLSSAPSPVVTTTAPDVPAVDAPFEWDKPTKDESAALLDLPSPAPVTAGSPFDVFNSFDAPDNHVASAVVMPPTAPAADAASAALPPVDLADLFGSGAPPVDVPTSRAPPPPVPFVATESTTINAVENGPPTTPSEAQAPTPSSPPPPAQAKPEEIDVLTPFEELQINEVSPPVVAESSPFQAPTVSPHDQTKDASNVASSPSGALSESNSPFDTSDERIPSNPPSDAGDKRSSTPVDLPTPTVECTVDESAEAVTTSNVIQPERRADAEITTAVETLAREEEFATESEPLRDVDRSRISDDGSEVQTSTNSTFEEELAALAASPSPVLPSAEPIEVSPQLTSAPPAPVDAKTKSPIAASTRTSKPPTNGASTPESKNGATKSMSAPLRRTPGTQATTTPPPKGVPKTGVPKTPTKQAAKPATVSPSAAPGASKAGVTKTPTFQRSLSASTATRKPTKSPTSGNTSPTPASDTEPKIVKKKLSASEIDAAGNRLYEQAMESKRRLEAKKALREEEFTFTPQVNPKSKKLDNADAPNRFVLLHERAKEAQRKKEELREKLEKEECTFKPQITNKAKKIASSSDKPRFENLYRNALEIQAKREEKKKQEKEKDEEELTFKPKIKSTKSPVRSRPLYDPEVVKQKRLELEQKKMEAEQQAKPKVVRKAKADDADNKIFDRLYQGGQQRAERLARLKQEREEQEKAATTFQPKVSSAAASNKSSSQPFHQRLYDKDYLKKVAAEREQRKIEEEKKRFSFKPRVSDVPDSVKSKGSSEGGSTGKSTIFERLYQDKNRVKEKIELSEELKIQKEMEECTFRPQIDVPTSTTSKGEATTPIWERLLSIDKNQIADERERLKAQLELEACTFRPEISPTPGSLSPKRASSHDIFERLSTSAGNTPVDEKKRRPSERKSIASAGKRNSYNERGSVKDPNSQRPVLSVGDILKSSKLGSTPSSVGDVTERDAPERANSTLSRSELNGSSGASTSNPAENVARSLEMELNEPDALTTQSKSIMENYDTWAASLEEKMRNL